MSDATRMNAPLKGALYMSAAAVTMALVGTSVKWATEGLPAPVVVFFRNLFGLVTLIPWLLGPRRIRVGTTVMRIHLMRACFGVAAMFSYFYAISGLSLAEAIVLNFTSPLFIPLVARLWLGERLSRRVLFAAALGFAGILVIRRPWIESGGFNHYHVVALASAVFASAALVTVRRLTESEPSGRIVFYFALGAAVLSGIPLPAFWQTPEARQWIPLLLTGALATLAQFLLSRGYARCTAGAAAVFHYLTVPAAALIGWLVWNEGMDRWMAAGALMICAAGIAASLGGPTSPQQPEPRTTN